MEINVVALFIKGPIPAVLAWIFLPTMSLINSFVADCFGSIPYMAFFALLASSKAPRAFVLASKNESNFWKIKNFILKLNDRKKFIKLFLLILRGFFKIEIMGRNFKQIYNFNYLSQNLLIFIN